MMEMAYHVSVVAFLMLYMIVEMSHKLTMTFEILVVEIAYIIRE